MKIIDCHLHLYDAEVHSHSFLNQYDPGFAEFVGNYEALPKKYFLEDYLQETTSYQVEGVVWHEFLSSDPVKEVLWASEKLKRGKVKYALVALIDLLDPHLDRTLETYKAIPELSGVRQHLVYHDQNPLKRFASRNDLMRDPLWLKNLKKLKNYPFKCALEVFSTQLEDLARVVHQNPDIQFTIPVMGWPIILTKEGQAHWKKMMALLAKSENTRLSISAIECIFGMRWTEEQIRPWLLTAIDFFGVQRTMFGSHLPITRLSKGFTSLYQAYQNITSSFSNDEKQDLFYNSAKEWFRL